MKFLPVGLIQRTSKRRRVKFGDRLPQPRASSLLFLYPTCYLFLACSLFKVLIKYLAGIYYVLTTVSREKGALKKKKKKKQRKKKKETKMSICLSLSLFSFRKLHLCIVHTNLSNIRSYEQNPSTDIQYIGTSSSPKGHPLSTRKFYLPGDRF